MTEETKKLLPDGWDETVTRASTRLSEAMGIPLEEVEKIVTIVALFPAVIAAARSAQEREKVDN